MASYFDKICEYGQKRDQKALEEIMIKLDEDQLIDIMKTKINHGCFNDGWNYVLKSFTDTVHCHSKRFKIVLCILKEVETSDVPISRINSIISRLCVELVKLKSVQLAELCAFCLESLRTKRCPRMSWKDLLPELLNVLVERDKFEYNDLEYTGIEYKTDFINTLCMSSWSPNIVTSLTAVFADMPLSKEEHLKVVMKLGTYIEKLTPQEIPAFVYQLLRLCKHSNGRAIFLRLQGYFGLRIYNNPNLNGEGSSESNTNEFDAIETTSNLDTIDAESTVLYHIHTAASLGHECIKDYISSLKNILRAPEFVLNPFQLMVLFTISTISHYEETIFNIIRPCIVRSYNEEYRKNNSYWCREMIPLTHKPEEVFSQVVQFSIPDRDLVLRALINFGFVLLEVGSALGRDPIAEKQWNLGNMILLKIIKRKQNIALSIIQTLSNHIVTRQNATQYIECLYILSKTMPLLMLENQSCIIELVDSLVRIPGSMAIQLLDALIPLTKISPTIRDHLIILLRKALYSRITETRQMAVTGFLRLLTNLKISNLAALSQSSNTSGSFSSGHSLFTQLSLNRSSQTVSVSAFSNEALCLEVLSILRRCFMQQQEVRMQLYEGLYDSICVNPELGIPVLDMIWIHFSEYYVTDEESLPPLNFHKISVNKDVESILLEPLGKLIYAVGLIVTKVSELEENKENSTVIKFVNVLESLCQRMIKCELIHFELDDGTDLLDIVPESQQKVHMLREAMNVYEALIGYKICSWDQYSENQGQIIYNLYQGYSRLIHFTKTLSKPKKAGGKKKKSDNNRTTQATQANTVSKKDGQKLSRTFKIPDTLLDFRTIKKALSLLHEPKIDWTVPAQANILKTKCEFHQHIMQATVHLIQNIKRHKVIESEYKKMYYGHIVDIATVLFMRIVKRLNEFIDFDGVTAVLAMDCFCAILMLLSNQYKSNFKSFLHKIVEDEKEKDDFTTRLTSLVNIYQKQFEMDEEYVADDAEMKKLSLVIINTLSILTSYISNDSNDLSIQILEWLKDYAHNKTVSSKVSSAFINLLLETNMKYKVSLTLLEHISVGIGEVVGVITEEEQNSEKFKVINEGTAHSILLILCTNVKTVLEDIDAVIARLKSEFNVLNYPGAENVATKMDKLKTKERGLCCQICFVVAILTNLSNLTIQPGNMSEAIFKNIILLFGTLNTLTKYFIMRSSKVNLAFQGARFERLVKLAGKQLAPAVYKFIEHIEESQKQTTNPTQSKKKKVDSSILKSKVLRETRFIPKVVYEMEQFSKSVIQLSNKTKVDLAKYVGQGTVRDYRIVGLKEILEQGEDTGVSHSTEINVTRENENTSIDNEEENGENEETGSPPPSKKPRI